MESVVRILTFADMGIGNTVFYLPVLRALAKEDLTIYCPNERLRELLKYNIKADYEIKGKFDISINNFLSQNKRHLAKIWNIPKRIGHKAWWRDRSLIFTDKVPMFLDKGEEEYNNNLLKPLGMKPIFEKIRFPDFNMPNYDIIISRYSGTPARNWEHWDELICALKQRGYNIKVLHPKEPPLIALCDMLSKCKLFIGNDSGLAKITANLGVKTIQIFRWFGEVVRCRVKGTNLIEPSVEEVLIRI